MVQTVLLRSCYVLISPNISGLPYLSSFLCMIGISWDPNPRVCHQHRVQLHTYSSYYTLCTYYLSWFQKWGWFFLSTATDDGRSTTLCLLYGQLSQGWMADLLAFIASKSFDLWNHHIAQMKWHNLRHILMYQMNI